MLGLKNFQQFIYYVSILIGSISLINAPICSLNCNYVQSNIILTNSCHHHNKQNENTQFKFPRLDQCEFLHINADNYLKVLIFINIFPIQKYILTSLKYKSLLILNFHSFLKQKVPKFILYCNQLK
jgi:hypothetical protein